MSWNPERETLAEIWVAIRELQDSGVPIAFNSVTPKAPHEMVELINAGHTDLMRGGGCIHPPEKILEVHKEHFGGSAEAPEWKERVAQCLSNMDSTDALRAQSKVESQSISKAVKNLLGSITLKTFWSVLAGGWVIAIALVLHIGVCLVFLEWIGTKPIYVLIVCGLLYLSAVKWTVETALNPSSGFFFGEVFSNHDRRLGKRFTSPVYYAIMPVGYLSGAFIGTAIAYEAYLPGTFYGVADGRFEQRGLQWVVYFADNLVRTIGLDTAEIFRIDLSRIEHGSGWPAAAFVWSFRVVLSVFGISYLVNSIKRYS